MKAKKKKDDQANNNAAANNTSNNLDIKKTSNLNDLNIPNETATSNNPNVNTHNDNLMAIEEECGKKADEAFENRNINIESGYFYFKYFGIIFIKFNFISVMI